VKSENDEELWNIEKFGNDEESLNDEKSGNLANIKCLEKST